MNKTGIAPANPREIKSFETQRTQLNLHFYKVRPLLQSAKGTLSKLAEKDVFGLTLAWVKGGGGKGTATPGN